MNLPIDALLKAYPVINELPVTDQNQLISALNPVSLPERTQVFDEHQPCRGFPFVISGAIRVIKSAPNGRELPLYRVLPGETCFITASCLLGQQEYNARGETEYDTQILMLPRPVFEEMLVHEPFRRFVFLLFAERIADLMQLVEEVAFMRLDQRLAALLLGHGREFRTTHQQLAQDLGSVREIVSRLLKGFEHRGLVKLGRESIEILDPAGLRQLAGTTGSM
ncbi:MAG: Crp/Fnr family transcriptional regulator [Hydrogenophilaceae bacterium]|nr:Crp/Fnr family transcriptional regulator [Hydrogenophilaceae bacterium]